MNQELYKTYFDYYKKSSGKIAQPLREDVHQERLKELEINKKEIDNAREVLQQDFQKEIFPWIKKLSSKYLLFVGFLLLISGILSYFDKNFISDNVLITLLATTTATIVGLPLALVRSIFINHNNNKNN